MSCTIGSREQIWQDRIDEGMKEQGREIVASFPEAHSDSLVEHAAAIHAYVYQKIESENRDFASGDPRPMRMPRETWKLKKGNCQEISILIASLLKSAWGLEVRTLGLDHPEKSVGHRILEIGIPYHPEDVSEVLEAFYNRSLHTDNFPGYCMYSEGDNRAWFVADRNRECIGDISFLEKGGYIEDYGNGYEWCDIGDCYSI